MKCSLWRWKRPAGLTSRCRTILYSIFCCAFPGLIAQSSSEGIWQEYSSVLTGIWSQVPLAFSAISIIACCYLRFLFSVSVRAYCRLFFQVEIWCLFSPEEHLALPRYLLCHLCVLLKAMLLLQANNYVWI